MRFITLDKNNQVVSVRYGTEIVDGEIPSDVGELGQIMKEDGSFVNPSENPPIQPGQPTLSIEERFEQLQKDNIVLMDALATTFEQILILETKIDTKGGGV